MTDAEMARLSEEVCAVLVSRGAKARGDEMTFSCPRGGRHNHGDLDPSAGFNVRAMVWKCFGCGSGGGVIDLAMALGMELEPMSEQEQILRSERARWVQTAAEAVKAATAAHRGCEAHLSGPPYRDWLSERGIDTQTAQRFGLVADHYLSERRGAIPAIAIPWSTAHGHVAGLQYRLLGDVPGGRYRWLPGTAVGQQLLYAEENVLRPADDELWIVEGAGKALALESHGIKASAICAKGDGAVVNFYRSELRRLGRVYVCLDPDAVREAVEVVRSLGSNARLVELPGKIDDLLCEWRGDVDLLQSFAHAGRAA